MNFTEEQSLEAFLAWIESRGVWPRLTHKEIFEAGWQAAIRFAQGHLTTPPKIMSVVKD